LRGNVDPASGDQQPTPNTPAQPINLAVIALPRVSNHDDLDPFRRAGCRIRVVISPHELTDAHIIFIPGSKSTIADLRWMKTRGLDTAVIDAANRGVTVVGICGGYQILGQQLDDPDATESPEPQSEPGLDLLPINTIFDTEKTTRRVSIEIPEHDSGPIKGPHAAGYGYEIHTGITTGTETPLAVLSDDTNSPSNAEEPGEGTGASSLLREAGAPRAQGRVDCSGDQVSIRSGRPELNEKSRLRGNASSAEDPPPAWPDGASSTTLPVIGSYVHGLFDSYVHGLFDSPDILRRLLNTTADNHNLPRPLVQDFSMEAEYDRLAAVVREAIDMDLIKSMIE
jgi:cobyric acid synthase